MPASANLAPWNIDEKQFPVRGSSKEKLQFLLNYAVLAPSGHNTQPWHFVVNEDTVELRGDPSRRLAMADPLDRELVVSCGAALLNLRIAMQHFGYSPEVDLLPDPEARLLIARVRLAGPMRCAPEAGLFRAITQRHTNRGDYEHRQIPAALLLRLEAAAAAEGATLNVIESERMRNAVARLIEEADHRQASDPHYRRELADWLRSNGSSRKDGIPGSALGFNSFSSVMAPFLVRNFELDQADEDRRQIMETPELAVLWTAADTMSDWLKAGQALGRVLLRAYSEGLQASFFSQVLEVEITRSELHHVLNLPGCAQMVLRLGFSDTKLKPTPRRSAAEVTS